jgi:hypothetical protein
MKIAEQLRARAGNDTSERSGKRRPLRVSSRNGRDLFSWTPTGIVFSLNGLTLDAADLRLDRYGQKAIVSVWCRDQLCYRQPDMRKEPAPRQVPPQAA